MIKKYPGFKVYIVHCETGTIGTDSHEVLVLPEDHTETELDYACWDLALNNAESYGIYPPSDDDEEYLDEMDNDWGSDATSDDINGYPEEYDPDKHEGLRAGGGSFEDDIAAEIKRS